MLTAKEALRIARVYEHLSPIMKSIEAAALEGKTNIDFFVKVAVTEKDLENNCMRRETFHDLLNILGDNGYELTLEAPEYVTIHTWTDYNVVVSWGIEDDKHEIGSEEVGTRD